MPVVAAALSGLAGVSLGLMLLAVAGAAFSIWSLWRLRQHCRVLEAAERLEGVNLSSVVRRYVPRALRSHRRAEEMRLAKQIIDARRPGWKRWAIVSAALAVCSATATTFFVHRNLQAMTVVRAAVVPAAATPSPTGDVLAAIQGVWGWRADFLQSCAENPQVISVSSDRTKLLLHYAKPINAAPKPLTDLYFDVVSAQPDMLVLSGPISATDPDPHPPTVSIKFLDVNTYIATRSDRPLQTTGTIERCH